MSKIYGTKFKLTKQIYYGEISGMKKFLSVFKCLGGLL